MVNFKYVLIHQKGVIMAKYRDNNILKSYRREINLSTKKVASKKAYNRKKKHKGKNDD
jgi:hypothetical protein